jgi:hypothetical protein
MDFDTALTQYRQSKEQQTAAKAAMSARDKGARPETPSNVPPDAEELAALNDRFGHLCRRGRIERSAPLSVEQKEGDAVDLPRLRFTFARHGFAQLRGLIDALNDLAA